MIIPAVSLAVWSPRGLPHAIEQAKPLLARVRPPCVMLHDSPSQLQLHAAKAAEVAQSILGRDIRLWLGVAEDAGITDAKNGTLSPAQLLKRRAAVADLAKSIGADCVMHNAEAAWKLRVAGFTESDARELVRTIHVAHPELIQAHTAYDQPTLHGSYCWAGWSACDLFAPQIYWAGYGTGPTRLAAHRLSWTKAQRKGWLPGGPIAPYLQCHGVKLAEVCGVADKFDGQSSWCSSETDEDGVKSMAAMSEIDRRGFRGPGRIARFQASAGLQADSIVGPQTLRALGLV